MGANTTYFNIQCVPFIVSANTAALLHKRPASSGTSRDSCRSHKRGTQSNWTWCYNHLFVCLFVFGATAPPPQWAMASSFTRFLDHTQRRTTVGRTPLDEWSARRRDLYLTTHRPHNRQTSMPPVRFEPTVSRRAAADLRLRSRGRRNRQCCVESSWNVKAHGDAWKGKWRGNWRMEWVASTLHTTSHAWCIQHYYRRCAHLSCQ